MKNLLIATFLLSIMACATVRAPVVDPYSHISVATVKEACGADEYWNVGVLGVSGLVMRFDNCLKIKFLLAIAIAPADASDIIKHTSIDLLAMHYMEYLKRENVQKEYNRVYSIKKIKEEKGDEWITYFFEISFKEVECDGATCIPKKIKE